MAKTKTITIETTRGHCPIDYLYDRLIIPVTRNYLETIDDVPMDTKITLIIEISVRERTATITESEFDKAWNAYNNFKTPQLGNGWLKDKLFGDKRERGES